MVLSRLINVLLVLFIAVKSHSISEFGKIHMKDSSEKHEKENSNTFLKAIVSVNATNSTDRTLLVPSGFDFSMFPVDAVGLHDITFVINGTIRATKNYKEWPI